MLNLELIHACQYRPELPDSTPCYIVEIGMVRFIFSYSTIVGFWNKGQYTMSENIYSNTTGRHINAFDPEKENRLSRPEFEKACQELINQLIIS